MFNIMSLIAQFDCGLNLSVSIPKLTALSMERMKKDIVNVRIEEYHNLILNSVTDSSQYIKLSGYAFKILTW